jgi:hypothetical protein
MPRIDGQHRVSGTERRLVEWVAQAKVGDALPEPWSGAYDPLESIIRTLADLGVIARAAPDADRAAIAREASVAARAWLDEHPAHGASSTDRDPPGGIDPAGAVA